MTRTIRKTAAFAAVILCVGAAAAFAANGPPLIGVTKSSMNGVKQAAGSNGALKVNAVGNRQIKFGSVSCGKLSADLKMALCTGKPGAPGTPGAPGANGNVGSPGKNGGTGDNGGPGSNGSNGGKGDNGGNGSDGSNGHDGRDAPGVITTHVTGGDSSVCGPDWANDTYSRTLQIVPQDNGTINVIRSYRGTFETIAGAPAPNGPCPGTAQAGGVHGVFSGFDVVVISGGTYNPDANCAANCTTAAMVAAFFPGGTSAVHDGWEYHYHTAANGDWVNASLPRGGNTGNIAG